MVEIFLNKSKQKQKEKRVILRETVKVLTLWSISALLSPMVHRNLASLKDRREMTLKIRVQKGVLELHTDHLDLFPQTSNISTALSPKCVHAEVLLEIAGIHYLENIGDVYARVPKGRLEPTNDWATHKISTCSIYKTVCTPSPQDLLRPFAYRGT